MYDFKSHKTPILYLLTEKYSSAVSTSSTFAQLLDITQMFSRKLNKSKMAESLSDEFIWVVVSNTVLMLSEA